MKRYKLIAGTLLALACLLLAVLMPQLQPAFADPTSSAIDSACASINNNGDCTADSASAVTSIIKLVLNILSILIGFVAVVMIIVNAFKFVTSGGDAGQVKSARSGIVYALIGLAIAALAQVLVYFVIGQVNNSQNPASSKPTAAQCKKNPKLKGC